MKLPSREGNSTSNATVFVSVCKLHGGRVSDIDNAQCYEDPPLNNSREHESYGGPACKACRNSSYTMSNAGVCKWCPEGAQVGNLFIGFATIMFLLLLAFTKLFWSAHDKSKDKKKKKKKKKKKSRFPCLKGKKKNQEDDDDAAHLKALYLDMSKKEIEEVQKDIALKLKLEKQRGMDAIGRFAGDQAMVGRMSGSEGGSPDEQGPAMASNQDAARGDAQVLTDRVKVFYSWLQVFTATTFTFDTPWPASFKGFTTSFDFINLDPTGWFPHITGPAGCTFNVGPLLLMVVHVSTPIVLVLVTVIARIPAKLKHKHQDERRAQTALQMKLLTSLSLIVYPGICTRLFSCLKSMSVAGLKGVVIAGTANNRTHTGSVMMLDYSTQSMDPEKFIPFLYVILACMLLYVIGIPLGVFIVLKKNKKYLHPDPKAVAKLDDEQAKLYEQKHEDCLAEFGTLCK